jgi:hypothetical protein
VFAQKYQNELPSRTSCIAAVLSDEGLSGECNISRSSVAVLANSGDVLGCSTNGNEMK